MVQLNAVWRYISAIEIIVRFIVCRLGFVLNVCSFALGEWKLRRFLSVKVMLESFSQSSPLPQGLHTQQQSLQHLARCLWCQLNVLLLQVETRDGRELERPRPPQLAASACISLGCHRQVAGDGCSKNHYHCSGPKLQDESLSFYLPKESGSLA